VLTDLNNKTTAAFTILNSSNARSHHIRTNLQVPETMALGVAISAGLPAENKTTLQQDWSTTLTGRLDPLRITGGNWREEGSRLVFQLAFNWPVPLDDLKAHLQVSPSVADLRVEPGANFNIHGAWRTDQLYQITVTSGVKFGKIRTLDKPLLWRGRPPRPHPQLAILPAGKYYIPRSNAAALALESRNVEKAEVTLYRCFRRTSPWPCATCTTAKAVPGSATAGPRRSRKSRSIWKKTRG